MIVKAKSFRFEQCGLQLGTGMSIALGLCDFDATPIGFKCEPVLADPYIESAEMVVGSDVVRSLL